MSELRYVIDICGLEEGIRCAICENPMHTDKGCDGNCKYNEKAFKRITDLLDKRIELLPIAPEPHWIPVTERPDKSGDYLVTLIDGAEKWVEIVYWNETFGGNWQAVIGDEEYYSTIGNVIAWMPLPEPFKGVTE